MLKTLLIAGKLQHVPYELGICSFNHDLDTDNTSSDVKYTIIRNDKIYGHDGFVVANRNGHNVKYVKKLKGYSKQTGHSC